MMESTYVLIAFVGALLFKWIFNIICIRMVITFVSCFLIWLCWIYRDCSIPRYQWLSP